MEIGKKQIRRIVSECVLNAIMEEGLPDLVYPEALEPELVDLYEKFRNSNDDNEKRELMLKICGMIDNRNKY